MILHVGSLVVEKILDQRNIGRHIAKSRAENKGVEDLPRGSLLLGQRCEVAAARLSEDKLRNK